MILLAISQIPFDALLFNHLFSTNKKGTKQSIYIVIICIYIIYNLNMSIDTSKSFEIKLRLTRSEIAQKMSRANGHRVEKESFRKCEFHYIVRQSQ